jgi:hypothetical protein
VNVIVRPWATVFRKVFPWFAPKDAPNPPLEAGKIRKDGPAQR